MYIYIYIHMYVCVSKSLCVCIYIPIILHPGLRCLHLALYRFYLGTVWTIPKSETWRPTSHFWCMEQCGTLFSSPAVACGCHGWCKGCWALSRDVFSSSCYAPGMEVDLYLVLSICLYVIYIYIYTVEIWCAVFLSFGSNLIFTSARTRSRPQPIDIPGFLVTWCYFDMLWYNNYKIRVCQNITWVTFSTCLRSMINSQGHLERNTVRPRRQSRQANVLKLNKVCPYPKYLRQMGEKLKGTESYV